MRGFRPFSIWLTPVCAGFGLVLALYAAQIPGPTAVRWELVGVVFGSSLGYAVVLTRRPRRVRGGAYFLVAASLCLAAAIWVRSVNANVERPLLLFIAGGANLAGVVLSDDVLGAALQRILPALEVHPTRGALLVGVTLGTLVGGMDLVANHDLAGAILRGSLVGGAVTVLQLFMLSLLNGASASRQRRHNPGDRQ